jgi:hypothetical protein
MTFITFDFRKNKIQNMLNWSIILSCLVHFFTRANAKGHHILMEFRRDFNYIFCFRESVGVVFINTSLDNNNEIKCCKLYPPYSHCLNGCYNWQLLKIDSFNELYQNAGSWLTNCYRSTFSSVVTGTSLSQLAPFLLQLCSSLTSGVKNEFNLPLIERKFKFILLKIIFFILIDNFFHWCSWTNDSPFFIYIRNWALQTHKTMNYKKLFLFSAFATSVLFHHSASIFFNTNKIIQQIMHHFKLNFTGTCQKIEFYFFLLYSFPKMRALHT